MKNTLLILSLILSGASIAQNIEKCLSHKAIEYQESLTPGFTQHVNNTFNAAKAYPVNQEAKSGNHVIPVVVHIVYNTPEQNIPDSVIHNQIMVLNQDYNRWNADTVNMRPEFDIVKGSMGIEFKLAQIDEFGAPTTGITRTQTATTSFGSLAILGGDFSDLEKIKSSADGGIDPWDQTRYLNIWVGNMSVFGITALLGYATPPAGLPNWPPGSTPNLSDGVVIQYEAFGSNNPNDLDPGSGPVDVRGRTAVHEVGHYLGLRHIWGDGDCTAEDGIDDTPNADNQSNSDCDPSKNTCTDNIQGQDLPDMIENFMDYSAETCQNSFTQGQVDLMNGVLEVERYDLVHNNPAAIDEVETATISVYPNPTNGLINLTNESTISDVHLIDLTGKVVKEIASVKPYGSIDLNGLYNGVYILKFKQDDLRSKTIRIVKQ